MGDLETVKAAIDEYPDFPKKGILFQDVFGIFRKPEAHKALQNLMVQHAIAHKEEVHSLPLNHHNPLYHRHCHHGKCCNHHHQLPTIIRWM